MQWEAYGSQFSFYPSYIGRRSELKATGRVLEEGFLTSKIRKGHTYYLYDWTNSEDRRLVRALFSFTRLEVGITNAQARRLVHHCITHSHLWKQKSGSCSGVLLIQ